MGFERNVPKYIVLHHSYNPEDDVLFEEWDNITNYHINVKGWLDVGYHYGIEYVNGEVVIQNGRPENANGAHCKGLNTQSIGICVIGNYDNKKPDDKMIDRLVELIQDIYTRWGELPIVLHRDYANKSCPGLMFPIDEVKERLKKHWGSEYRDNLINKGVAVAEERYDDPITRAEAFALLDRVMEVIESAR